MTLRGEPTQASARRYRRRFWRLPDRDAVVATLRAEARTINPIVAFRGIALLLAMVIISSDLHVGTNMQDDAWLLFLAAGHLALTALVASRLPSLGGRVNVVAIALDIIACVAFVWAGGGWQGPFWLYGVSAVFWPSYRFGLRGALSSVSLFDVGVLLTSRESLRATYNAGFAGDLLARLTMVLIVAGAVAFTARALKQVRALAAESERNRIARDLHDGVGKTLGGISMEAGSLASWIARDPVEARRRARYVARISERAAIEVRDVIRSLRQQESTALLFDEVRATVAEWAVSRPEAVHVQLNGADLEMPVLIRAQVLRMLNELLENVRRHARAEQVWVRVTLSKQAVTLAVRDDGTGFDQALWDPWADEGHFGLLGARERAWMLGGHFQLAAAPGHGTDVTIDLPLSPREERGGLR